MNNTYYILTFGTSDLQYKKEDILNASNVAFLPDENEPKQIEITFNNGNNIKVNIKKNRSFHDFFLLNSPRNDGKTIIENFDIFKNLIIFPLIYPIFESRNISENDKIILVYTDQHEEGFNNNDTLYYSEIFKKFLCYKKNIQNPNIFIDFPINEQVVNIDYQYRNFESAIISKKLIPDDNFSNIILLAQGGIDQINYALTLQLIKHYGTKVKILQIKESNNDRKENELKFAYIFTRDLLFDKIEHLVSRGDYAGSLEILKSFDSNNTYNDLIKWLEFADYRSRYLFNLINNIGKKAFSNQQIPEFIQSIKNKHCSATDDLKNLFNINDNQKDCKDYLFPICERFEKVKFLFDINAKEEAILNFQIAIETFLLYYIKKHFILDITGDNYNNNQYAVLEKLNNDKETSNLVNSAYKKYFSRNNNFTEIKNLTPPVLLSIIFVKEGLITKNENNEVLLNTNDDNNKLITYIAQTNSNYKNSEISLDKMRNQIAHRGEGINDQDFDKVKKFFQQLITHVLSDDSLSYQNMNKHIIDCFYLLINSE